MGKLIRSGNYDAVLCFIGYVRATFWIACLASKLSRIAFIFGADTTSLTPQLESPIKRLSVHISVTSCGLRQVPLC